MSNSRRSGWLACTAFGAMVAAAAPSAGVAQDRAQGRAGEVEELVVTGERARAQRGIQLKRESAVIYDAAVADDIGRLPDLNVSDAFRRLPGVSAVLDEDEGRFVTVRGLSSELNYVTIDGLAVATHDAFGGGGRSVNLEVIPSSVVSRLEIFKSFTPDMDGHAVGGYLNVATRSAFDDPGFQLRADASLARYTLRALPTSDNHDPEGRLGLTVSNTFADDRFGVLLSLSYDRKARDETKIIPDGYSYFNAAGQSTGSPLIGNGYAAPNQFRFFIYDDELQRAGAFGRLDARWNSAWSSSLSGFLFHQENAENRYGHQILGLAGITNQTATSGTYARGVGEVSYSFFPIERRNAGLNFATTYEPDDRQRLDVRIGYSFSDFTHDTPNVQFRTAANAGLGVSYDTSGLIPSFQVANPAVWGDLANYKLFQYDFRNLRTDEDIVELKADYRFNAGDGARGFGVLAGGGHRVLDREVDNDQRFFTNPGQTLDGLLQGLNYAPPGRTAAYAFFDYAAFERLVAANPGAFPVDATRSLEASLSGDFGYREAITAAYGAATYGGDRWRAVAGLRFENVDVETETYVRETGPTPDRFRPTTLKGDYQAWLPSLNLSYDLTDELRVRLGASRSVGRPNPSSIGQQLSVSTDGLTVTLGNPDLKPRRSDNFDVSLEYSFGGGDGLISAAVFRKEIADEIVTVRSQGEFEGRPVTFVRPENAEDAAVHGLELALVKGSLDFLPAPFDGLGVSGNAAFIDGEFSFTGTSGPSTFKQLISQPKRIYNASVFYNWRDRAEVRVAYHRVGDTFNSANTTSPWLSRGTPATEQWDLTGRYDIDAAWSVRLEARNLTNEDQFITEGPGFDRLIEQVDYGRSFWFGVTWRQ